LTPRALLFAALFAAIASHTVPAQEEVEISPANKLYLQAVTESERASKLERRGKLERAVDGYELAGRLSEGSIAEAERTWRGRARSPAAGLLPLRDVPFARRAFA
jgi:hypothetical protein